MKLYHVQYCNGAEYDDWINFHIGVYSTESLAQEASKLALIKHGSTRGAAFCNIEEIIVDEMPEVD